MSNVMISDGYISDGRTNYFPYWMHLAYMSTNSNPYR